MDDNPQNLYLLQVLLKGNGYEVMTATNGAEALEMARREPPALIITDILMPVMDGFSLCREWMKDEVLKAVPFVFYTATYTEARDEELALDLGAARFIVKPVEPAVFAEMVRLVIHEAEEGRLVAPRKPIEEEPVFLKQYSERLVKKLEDKLLQLERANRRLTALYTASTGLAAVKRLEELVPHALRVVVQALGFSNASYFAFDEERQEFRLQEAVGFPEELVEAARRALVLSLGEERGLVGLVGQIRQPLIVADTLQDPRWIAVDESIRSVLFVPVVHEGRLLGVANFLNPEPEAFDQEDIHNLMILANNLAVAIQNTRLLEGLRQSEGRYRRLAENARDLIYRYRFTPTPGFEYVSPAATEISGYTPGEHYADPELGLKLVHPEDRPELEAYFQGEGEFREPITLRWVRKDGTVIWTEQRNVPIYDDAGNLVALEGIARDVTRRVQRERELEAVVTVSAALRTAQTRAEMLPAILDQLLILLDADGAAFGMLDPASGELLTELGRGAWAPATGERIPPGAGLSAQVLARREPYVNNDARSDPRLFRPDLLGECRAVAGVPLLAREHIIGLLWVGHKSDVTAEHVRLLTAIADMAANAVHRATLHEQTERQVQRLTALHSIDMAISASLDLRVTLNVLLDQTTSQLGVDAAAVLLLDPHTRSLEYAAGRGFRSAAMQRSHLRLGEGLVGRAVLERRTISIADLRLQTADWARQQSEISNLQSAIREEGFVAYYAVPLIAKGEIKGVLEVFDRAPLRPDREWLSFLETLATQTAIAIDNVELFEGLQQANTDLALAYDATLEGWARALELRDYETEGHSRRVTEMTLRLARAMGVPDRAQVHIRRGALLHDIGKMGVPDSILLKPGPLTEEEREVVEQHPVYAYEMLSPIAFLRPALDIPYCHHEKWDGSGYPRGLRGEDIPLAARIFAVVDVYDALTSDRPYREAWSEEAAIEHIREQAGRHFDPEVVETFLGSRLGNRKP